MKVFKTPFFMRKVFPIKKWGFLRHENSVYLTFDDGPDPDITPWVLDFLASHQLKATFFCVGENVKRYPEIYQRILHEGHAVGNHTMRHENGFFTPTHVYINSILEAENWIDSTLFRPPYGRLTFLQTWKIKKKFDIIMWSWLSYDYDQTVPIPYILEKAQSQIRSGDIIVLHDNVKTKDRLQLLLPALTKLLVNKNLELKILEPTSKMKLPAIG